MKNPISLLIVLAFLLLLTLVSCSQKSEEEIIQEAKDAAEKTFSSSQTIPPNNELEHFSLHIPKHLEVEEVDENNIILSDTKQTYIVFYNSLEEPTSDLNYHIASSEDNEALLLDSFHDEEKFGYIQILPEDEDNYEIQVGVGGAKITTYTTKKRMIDHAEELMKIALSIG